jgi:hypothetical protein
LGIPLATAEAEDQTEISFRWAFGAVVGPKTDRRLVAITRDTTLKSGDQLKMFVELQKKCFVYLIYHSGQGEIHLLFPYKIQQFDKDYQLLKRYYIPKGDLWFELDQKVGMESFYLLASAQRLTGLEALLTAYNRSERSNKAEQVKQILAEIKRIRKQSRKLATVAERPVPIGGNVRGVDRDKGAACPDIAPIAGEVTATGFYGRTYTIDHR